MLKILEKEGFILSRTPESLPYNKERFLYCVEKNNHTIKCWYADEEWTEKDIESPEFLEGDVYSVFLKTINKFNNKQDKKITYNKKPEYKQLSLFNDDDVDFDFTKKSNNKSSYYFNNLHSYNYKREPQDIEPYCKSATLCLHKSDPTTTMLSQIYEGRNWDVINDSNKFSSEEIAQLIDRHDRIVMLGHGTPGGLIGFINPSHASHLEPKKLFALWCNADAYCDKYLPNKKGFFACGNMPSDDNEARWQGFYVSHKYMDDNITYWCKLCGDVIEQCLEGDADAGCKYIREKYWEKYHKGTADEVGITKYNYVRTKVAGQANLPEPKGEEITASKQEAPRYNYSNYWGWDYSTNKQSEPKQKVQHVDYSDKKDIEVVNSEILFETDKGYYVVAYKSGGNVVCDLYDDKDKRKDSKLFSFIKEDGINVYNSFKEKWPQIGELIMEEDLIKEELIKKHTKTLIKEGLMKEGDKWPDDVDPYIFEILQPVNEDINIFNGSIEDDFSISALDGDFETDSATTIIEVCPKNNPENIIYVNVRSNYDLDDAEIVWEDDGDPTYVPYGNRSVLYDTGKGGIEEVYCGDIIESEASFEDEESNTLTNEQVAKILNITEDLVNEILKTAITTAELGVEEQICDYIKDHESDFYPDDDYDPYW